MAVGMVLFWPALFFLEGGDGPEAAEYARLKRELDALETVSIHKSSHRAGIYALALPEPVVSAQSGHDPLRKREARSAGAPRA